MGGNDRSLTLPLTGGGGDTSPDLDVFDEQDSMRVTAELALDGHRLKLNRQEKGEVVRLALRRSWSREKAAHQLGISVQVFATWARRAQVEYPVDRPPLWWVHGYMRTDRRRRKARTV